MKIELLHHPECGYAIYINDVRIAGSKPWGGGSIVAGWNVKPMTILKAMGRKYATLGSSDEPEIATNAQAGSGPP